MMEVADAHKSVATIRTVVRATRPIPHCRPRRQRGRGGGRHRQRDRPPRAEYEKGPLDPRSRRPIRPPCGHDPWRDGAQHPRPRMRLRLGVPRPAGHVGAAPVAEVQGFVDTVALPRLTRFVSGPAIVTISRPRRGARRRARLAGRDAGAAADPVQPDDRRVLRHGVRPLPAGRYSDHRLRAGIDRSGAQARRIRRGVATRACLAFLDNLAGELAGSGATVLVRRSRGAGVSKTRQKCRARWNVLRDASLRRRSSGRLS